MDRQAAIVIVTCNSARFLAACLESALARSTDVVVVDNASVDDTLAVARRYPAVKLVANSNNAGFAAAVNQGIRSTVSGYILLLNPDAVLQSSIEPLIDACTRPDVAAAAGKLTDSSGHPQSGFTLRRFPTASTLTFELLGFNRLWPGNPVNHRYRCHDIDLGKPGFADQPAGAFLLFRRSLWLELDGFDEQFHPLWFEDVDFLLRASQKGHKIWFNPEVVALHYGGHSVEALHPATRRAYWYDSLLKYAAKHFRPAGVRVVAAAVLAGWAARRFVDLLLRLTGSDAGRSLGSGDQYVKVLRLAGSCLCSGAARKPPVLARAFLDGEEVEEARKAKLRNSHSHGL